MDTVDKATRSRIVAAIKRKSTKPEREMLRLANSLGAEPVLNDAFLPGCPDLAFHAHRLAVFVHGCFWHGCPVHYKAPTSNVDFWQGKVLCNQRRDARIRRRLNRMGWSVMVVWEHELKSSPGKVAARLSRRLRVPACLPAMNGREPPAPA